MNKRKVFSLSYFLGRAFFLGFGYSLLLSIADKDAWICFILGSLLGIMFVYLLSKIKEKMNGKNLREYLQYHKIFRNIILFLFFIFNLFIMIEILFILQTFAGSFFLIKSPAYFTILPIIYLIYRITKKSWSTIGRVGEILMPISFIIVVITSLILIPYGSLENFQPILSTSMPNILKCTIFFAFYSSAPFFLLLNAPMKDNKLVIKYIITTLTIVLIGVMIIAVLGPYIIKLYRYPEYMILKKIKVFSFLEKIENIISITWLIDLFMILAISGNNMKDILPQKNNKICFIILLSLIYTLIVFSGKYYPIELGIYSILPIILGCSEIILAIIFLIYQKHLKPKKE